MIRPAVRRRTVRAAAAAAAAATLWLAACVLPLPPDGASDDAPGFQNTSDPTNGGAAYVGSSACASCHVDVAERHAAHGHSRQLNRVDGGPPAYPPEGTRAGVPEPPPGFEWSDVSYVVGGYTKAARFVDLEGYLITTGRSAVDAQWNLEFPPNGTTPGFAPYEPDSPDPLPYDFNCFRCHTTGPQPPTATGPFQDNRPGLAGTWRETAIQCEACHGPGAAHFTISAGRVRIDRRRIYVDSTGDQTCRTCHSRPFASDAGDILADDGFISHESQYPELLASGGHAAFTCTTCHDPHHSVAYDRERAIRNDCTACHRTETMAKHDGAVYRAANGYTETLTCVSCHMPFATRIGSAASVDSVDFDGTPLRSTGRIGDVRTHIFRIDTRPVGFETFFSEDGTRVRRDADGLAAVTVDFVCLRCHNGRGNVFGLGLERAAEIAEQIHTPIVLP